MACHIDVKPELLEWAIRRAVAQGGWERETLLNKIPKYEAWLSGASSPTYAELSEFSRLTRAPFGYLFLDAVPPEEKLGIPDCRTMKNRELELPSLNLLETLARMQQRQEWMREYLQSVDSPPVDFVGSLKDVDDAQAAAQRIRELLGLAPDWLMDAGSRGNAIKTLRERIDNAGILIFFEKRVGNITDLKKRLDPEEFRGFVLVDDIAPLIFVNSRDAKSAQLFTIAHELAHLGRGDSGLFDSTPNARKEDIANRIAGEFLAPRAIFLRLYENFSNDFNQLAKKMHVSSLVIARRALDFGLIDRVQYDIYYQKHKDDWKLHPQKSSSPVPPERVLRAKICDSFSFAVIQSTHNGNLLYMDALSLVGTTGKSFEAFATSLMGGRE